MNLPNSLRVTIALATLFSIKGSPIHGECLCKVDIGPAYVHLDVLNEKKTVKKLDMPAIRGDLSLVIGRGWCLKPTALYGKGDSGELQTYGICAGRCLPIFECIIVTPQIGVTYTRLATSIHLASIKFHERMRSLSPYAGAEVILKFAKDWRLCLSAQYAWSRSKTKIKKFPFELPHPIEHSDGPNYGILLEYDINHDWSVNIGAAYNETLSKEDNGIRARGAKIGIARWF